MSNPKTSKSKAAGTKPEPYSSRKSSSARVSMFLCHKVAIHRDAAERIKDILQSRTERLDVHICEDIEAGDKWRCWIEEKIGHSRLLLALLPQIDQRYGWIKKEIRQFKEACPDGKLIMIKPTNSRVPEVLSDRQMIETSREALKTRFLRPLYMDATFTGLNKPLNDRVSNADLEKDAEEIEKILVGRTFEPRLYWERLEVDLGEAAYRKPLDLSAASVDATANGCKQILNWDKTQFSWNELLERAKQERSKGTFWVQEMEDAIKDHFQYERQQIMTSTFRGRGGSGLGRIFRPQLNRVDFDSVRKTPRRYHFVFHEVVVPEFVRGPGSLGEVFNLLHIANRARWEVFEPFVVKRFLDNEAESWRRMNASDRIELVSRVKQSLRIIEEEADNHQKQQYGSLAELDETANGLLKPRDSLIEAIRSVQNENDYGKLRNEIVRGLSVTLESLDLLAKTFAKLVEENSNETRAKLQKASEREAKFRPVALAATAPYE